MKLNTIVTIVAIFFMISAVYSVFDIAPVDDVNESIRECQINVTPADEPKSTWGQECMDCHQNPHDPMSGVPSEKEFDGHKNLDCVFCHNDYDNPQRCISCHEGHKIFSKEEPTETFITPHAKHWLR